MLYLKVNDILYPADFTGKMNDVAWDNRESKTIHSSDNIMNVLEDDTPWYIVDRKEITRQVVIDGEPQFDENGNPIMETVTEETVYDNSDYCVLGDRTIHNDNTYSVTMGKQTDLEEAYELLYGGE